MSTQTPPTDQEIEAAAHELHELVRDYDLDVRQVCGIKTAELRLRALLAERRELREEYASLERTALVLWTPRADGEMIRAYEEIGDGPHLAWMLGNFAALIDKLRDRVRELEADRERLDYLQRFWFRHGVVSYMSRDAGISAEPQEFCIFPADHEIAEGVDKYEDEHHWRGPTLRAAIDDAREPEDAPIIRTRAARERGEGEK